MALGSFLTKVDFSTYSKQFLAPTSRTLNTLVCEFGQNRYSGLDARARYRETYTHTEKDNFLSSEVPSKTDISNVPPLDHFTYSTL